LSYASKRLLYKITFFI